MVAIATIGLMIAAPAAPMPTTVPGKATREQMREASIFGSIVADCVMSGCIKPAGKKALAEAAVLGMYEECGVAVPDRIKLMIRKANNAVQFLELFTEARLHLANQPALRGQRALFVAINSFQNVTELGCQLTSKRESPFSTFGIGIELEGVSGKAWHLYQLEYGIAIGKFRSWLDATPRKESVTAPVGTRWRVQQVIPDSPAAKAGLLPGDIITHFNGVEITPGNVNELFGKFAFPPAPDLLVERIVQTLTLQRGTEKPFSRTIELKQYTPLYAFGVWWASEGDWDCLLDRDDKIGYIRIGPVESGLDVKVSEMVDSLRRQNCRGLILDLRWCTSGNLSVGEKIAGLFLPRDAVIALHNDHIKDAFETRREIRNNFDPISYANYPMVVLIGPETSDLGEFLAAALRDNDRCVLMGQRSAGLASIQTIVESGVGNLQLRVTTGELFRPSGKPRKRNPDSGPHGDWGLKPDEGLEVPLTLDKSKELRRWAELHSLRPHDSNETLDFDDLYKDPYRVTALAYLRKKIGKPK